MSVPRSLSRRALLRLGGAGLAGGVAGCQSLGGRDQRTTRATETATATSDTATRTTAPSRTLAPPEEGATCPPAPDGVKVHCGERKDDQRVWMSASKETLESRGDTIQFTFHNERDTPLYSYGSQRSLYYRSGDDWLGIRKRGMSKGLHLVKVGAGGTRTWEVHADGGDLDTTAPRPRNQELLFRFPTGRYAFGYDAWRGGWGEGEDGERSGPVHRYIAEFDVTGDPLSLRPSDYVTKAVRRGETLVVRTQPYRDYAYWGFEEEEREITVVAEKRQTAPDRASKLSLFELYNPDHRMAPLDAEQAVLPTYLVALLRDGFAHDDGSASRIRIETHTTQSSLTGGHFDGGSLPLPVVYDGTPWRLTSEDGWLEQ